MHHNSQRKLLMQNKVLKYLINKILVPKLEKIVKASTNTYDNKFLALFKELINTYL